MNRKPPHRRRGTKVAPRSPASCTASGGLLTPRLRATPRQRRIAPVDPVSLLRQLYAQVEDDALCGDLGDLLILDAGRLKQTITIDLDAASVPDNQAPGHVCFGCLGRSVDGTKHHWDARHRGPGEYWVCRECGIGE